MTVENEIESGATPEIVNEAPSMDDTIRQTLEDIQSRESTEERLRGPDGKFAKAEQETPIEEVAPEAVAAEAPEVEAQPETEPAVIPQDLQRLGLRKEEAEAFQKADPKLREAFLRRSEEMHKGLEQYREKATFGDSMAKAIEPFRATIASIGMPPDQAVQALFIADHKLRYGTPQDKISTIQTLAKQYGVDLTQAQPAAEAEWVDPNVQALQTQLQQMQALMNQNAAKEQQREAATLNSEIARFASDPAHSHFESVKGHMSALLQSGVAKDLSDAYEQAIYANPAVRAQVLAQQQAEAEAKRKADAIQKANEAKRAAAVNLPRRGAMAAAKPIGTMDDTIREAATRLGIIH